MFDQTDVDGIPKKYFSDGTMEGICNNGIDTTDEQMLYSKSQIFNQRSCKPNVGNAGNYYSWPAATAGGASSGVEPNSACPKGWTLTTNAAGDRTSYYHLIRTAYSINDSNDSKIRPLPLSFVRSGNYNQGSLTVRANNGYYWSSAALNSNYAYQLYSGSGALYPQYFSHYKYYDFSVRCVSK